MIDTSKYTVIRGEALLRSKGKEPPGTWVETWKNGTQHKRSIGTHPHGISAGHLTPKHKPVNADAWLELSCAHGKEAEARPVLGRVWQQGEYAVSVDGYRAHRVKAQVNGAIAWTPDTKYEGGRVPDFNSLYPHAPQYRFTVRTDALWRALHAVRPFARDACDIVRFAGNTYMLVISATSAEMGDAKVTIEGTDYRGENVPDEFALASRYALDALRGMGEWVTIATCGQYGNQPFVFSSGESDEWQALVMPMLISRD